MKVILVVMLLFGGEIYAGQFVCAKDGIELVRKSSLVMQKKKQYLDAVRELKPVIETCRFQLKGAQEGEEELAKAYYWAFSDYLLALRKAGSVRECISLGVSTLDSYNMPYPVEHAPEILAARHNLSACLDEREKQFKDFKAESCNIFGYLRRSADDKTSIRVPEAWAKDQIDSACVAIHLGTISDDHLDYSEGGMIHKVDRPYLILVTKTGEKKEERFYAFSGGRLGSNEVVGEGRYFILVAWQRQDGSRCGLRTDARWCGETG